jgi:hypothetical protein
MVEGARLSGVGDTPKNVIRSRREQAHLEFCILPISGSDIRLLQSKEHGT